jgi:hypothetical protein
VLRALGRKGGGTVTYGGSMGACMADPWGGSMGDPTYFRYRYAVLPTEEHERKNAVDTAGLQRRG